MFEFKKNSNLLKQDEKVLKNFGQICFDSKGGT